MRASCRKPRARDLDFFIAKAKLNDFQRKENGMTRAVENDGQLSEESKINLLMRLLDEGQAHATNFMKAFLVYIGIHGILLTAWIEVDSIDDLYLRYILGGVGLMLALLVSYVWHAWNVMRADLLSDFQRINVMLHRPYRHEQLLAMKYITMTAGLVAILTAIGWLALVLVASKGLTNV